MVWMDYLGPPEQVGTPLPLVRLKPGNQWLCSPRVMSLFSRACRLDRLAPNVAIVQSRSECWTLTGEAQVEACFSSHLEVRVNGLNCERADRMFLLQPLSEHLTANSQEL